MDIYLFPRPEDPKQITYQLFLSNTQNPHQNQNGIICSY